MRFKIDENLPSEVVDLLREAGHDAVSVLDQGFKGSSDEEVAQVAADEGRALITLDLDFSDIRAYPPPDYAGLIVLRPRDSNKYHLLNLLTRLLPVLEEEAVVRALWIVEDDRLRIRE